MLTGFEHDQVINILIPAVVSENKRMDVTADLWRAVLPVTHRIADSIRLS